MTLATSHGAAARPNASLLASSASSSSLVTLAGNGWPARLGAKPETPGQVAGEPLADAAPELLVLRAGPHPRPPATDPRARRGGCRPAGASCLASNWPPRAGSAYQALVSSEATWRSSRSRPRSWAPPGGSATGPPRPSRGAAHQLSPATSSGYDSHTGTHHRGRGARRPRGDLVPEHAPLGARRPIPGADRFAGLRNAAKTYVPKRRAPVLPQKITQPNGSPPA